MSKSPLAGAFAEGSTPEKKKNKKGAALLIIAGIGLTASVGGVFAANSITINDVEFGQGVSSTGSCVSSLTTTLTQAYDPAITDNFKADDVEINGDYTGCTGKTVNVDLRDSSGTSLLNFTFDVVSTSPGAGEIASGVGTYTNNVSASNIPAGDVDKITVTTE